MPVCACVRCTKSYYFTTPPRPNPPASPVRIVLSQTITYIYRCACVYYIIIYSNIYNMKSSRRYRFFQKKKKIFFYPSLFLIGTYLRIFNIFFAFLAIITCKSTKFVHNTIFYIIIFVPLRAHILLL